MDVPNQSWNCPRLHSVHGLQRRRARDETTLASPPCSYSCQCQRQSAVSAPVRRPPYHGTTLLGRADGAVAYPAAATNQIPAPRLLASRLPRRLPARNLFHQSRPPPPAARSWPYPSGNGSAGRGRTHHSYPRTEYRSGGVPRTDVLRQARLIQTSRSVLGDTPLPLAGRCGLMPAPLPFLDTSDAAGSWHLDDEAARVRPRPCAASSRTDAPQAPCPVPPS